MTGASDTGAAPTEPGSLSENEPMPSPDRRDPAALDPNALDPDALEDGRWLFAQPCAFLLGAANLAQVPESALPEIAFAGRSNVGKSSLVNALTDRKTLARTSNTPGRTQQLNFFRLGDRLMMVDLPGYGYAAAPGDEVAKWGHLMRGYLRGRAQLRRVLLLLDARHDVKKSDREIMSLLSDSAVNFQAVLTKADKLKPGQIEARRDALAPVLRGYAAAHPDILVTSSVKRFGIDAVRATIASLCAAKDAREE